ncbi:MAG: permease, partial [Chitinispirillaceae bacterium]|nr:permease [Chitinispirillaceae bacterium]
GILVFANWGRPADQHGVWHAIFAAKWVLTSLLAAGFALTLVLILRMAWLKVVLASVPTIAAAIAFRHEPLVAFTVGSIGLAAITATDKGEAGDWLSQTWSFVKQITPLLLVGVLAAGFFLGRVGHEGIIPSQWISTLVGGNSLGANFFASIVGAFMYFATLTEVPILQGLMGSGMGKGPALALLLAGPALSVQSVLVINAVIGSKKTIAYMTLVVAMSTVAGLLYGTFF